MDWWRLRPNDQPLPGRPAGLRPNVTELCPNLFIGDFVRPEDIAWLSAQFGVTAMQSLQDADDLRISGLDVAGLSAAADRCGVKFARTPVPDGSADQLGARLGSVLAQLAALVRAGERVYLHCNAGLNRAPTVAIAYLHSRCGMPLEEALAYVKRRRPCGPYLTVLEQFFAAPKERG